MPFRASPSVSKFCIKGKAVCDYKHIFEWDDELVLKNSSREMNPVQFLRPASRGHCPHSRLIRWVRVLLTRTSCQEVL